MEAPNTQVTDKELELLVMYVKEAKVVVEVGCYEGKTTASLAANCQGTIYSIDPFFKGRLGVCYGELIARNHCKRLNLSNVKFLKGLSHEVAPAFNHPIDFIFIDADHSYEAIKRDWNDWFPKMKSGGVIALHDSKQAANSPDYLGSMKFYDEDIPQIDKVEQIDSVDSLVVLRLKG